MFIGLVFLCIAYTLCIKPIVFAPGFGVQGLEARLTNVKEPHMWCRKNTDFFRLWMNIIDEIPHLNQECFLHNMFIDFDPENRTFHNHQGVEIRPPDFGGVDGVEYLDPIFKKKSKYMHDFIEYLGKFGYERRKSFRAAGFDWRQGPQEWMKNGRYQKLKELIEETSELNGNQKVHLLSHSEGGVFLQYFLAVYMGDEQEWKEKYVESYINLGTPFDGSKQTPFEMLRGFTYRQPFLKPVKGWRDVAKNIAGTQWLSPLVTDMDAPWLFTEKRNYTMNDYQQLLIDSGNEKTWKIYEHEQSCSKLLPPRVPTYCLYSTEVETPATFYMKDVMDPVNNNDVLTNERGDGTVGIASLQLCDDFASKQNEKVTVHRFKDIIHMDMIYSVKVMKVVADILLENE